jgi:hypothetical protein
MENFWKDIRFGWRTLIRRPGFTAVSVRGGLCKHERYGYWLPVFCRK